MLTLDTLRGSLSPIVSQLSTTQWVLTITTLFLITTVTYTFGRYLVDRKGLRKFPSPSIAAFTPLWAIYYSLQNRRWTAVNAAHKKLGPIVRLAPNHVSFAVPEALKDIYGHGSPILKDHWYSNQAGDNPNMADATDKSVHSQKRRTLANVFSPKEVLKVEPRIMELTKKLVRDIKVKSEGRMISKTDTYEVTADGVFDVRPWMNMFSYDAITSVVWSNTYGLLDKGDDMCKSRIGDGEDISVPAMETFHSGAAINVALAQLPNFWYHLCLKALRNTHAVRCSRHFGGMVRYLVEERLANSEAKDDLFSAIPLEPTEKRPIPMSIREVMAECNVMLNAGHDTTQTSLTNLIYLIAIHPTIQQKLYKELRGQLPGDSLIFSFNDIQKVTYLRACLDESMRVCTPTRFGLPRRTLEKGSTIAGHYISPDVTVSVPLDLIHMNETLFESASEFIPERWLTDAPTTARLVAGIPKARLEAFSAQRQNLKDFVQPFSLGPRACIGRNIAYMEMSICLAALLMGFEWELATEKHPNGLEIVERLPSNPKELFVRAHVRPGAVIDDM